MSIAQFIQIHHVEHIVYAAMFLGMFIDAAVIIFVSVFLLTQHALQPAFVIPILIAGVLVEQLVWYWIGLKLGAWSWLVRWADKIAAPFDRHLQNKPFRTIVISKFVYGLHRSVLARAGMLRLPFKTYLKGSFASAVIWLAVISALGYAFSKSYDLFKHYLRYAELIPLGFVIIYFVVEYFLSKRLKKEL